MFKSPLKQKNKKLQKPQTESSMKGLIDLYKVINDALYCRVQDQIPPSGCIGLTKEQRTRMASQETRSDANKALYYKIYTEIMEKEQANGKLGKSDKALMNEARQILEKTETINKFNRAQVKIQDAEDRQ